MKQKRIVTLLLFAIALGGCYSSARHVANVRPDTVKPDATLAVKYRLERIVLEQSAFSGRVAAVAPGGIEDKRRGELEELKARTLAGDVEAYAEILQKLYPSSFAPHSDALDKARVAFQKATDQDRQKVVAILVQSEIDSAARKRKEYEELLEEDKKSGPKGTHYADTEAMFCSVRDALVRNYPTVFTDTSDATPITVVVGWNTEYKKLPDYASIFSEWLWPASAEQETVYRLYVAENSSEKAEDALWKAYSEGQNKYPRPLECGSAVRASEVWESKLLPTGFIPCPGESDFPKTFCFMRMGKDSLVSNPEQKLDSRECFKHMVFEPKVDGDVVAAAIMRTLNRKHRAAEAVQMMKKGGAR